MNSAVLDPERLQQLQQEASNYIWVDDNQALAELCREWSRHPLLALDTEFQRTDTFYPKPGLIQVASAGKCYLVDPLNISDFSPFIALLQNPQVVKVLHACSEDLELFNHCYGVVPSPMFDCQVACSFLGMGLSIGYQRLLSTLFDIEVDKEETRSDWLQRPLTEAQKIYAAVDVVYLEEIYRLLETRLQEQQKFDWVLEDCEAQAKAACVEEDFELSYLQRFKQSWKLRPRNLSVLQALSAWREDVCRQRDMPRNFLLHNHSMMAIALKPPFNMRDLSAVERIRGKTLSNEGKEILEVIKKAWDRPPEEYPEPPPRPLSAQWSKKIKQLKAVINETAEHQGLAPEMLVRRKDLEQLIRSGMHNGNFVLPQELAGWREAVVGKALLKSLQGESD